MYVCYVMLCHVVSCRVMLCYVMLCIYIYVCMYVCVKVCKITYLYCIFVKTEIHYAYIHMFGKSYP
jgi:hypothetical protein